MSQPQKQYDEEGRVIRANRSQLKRERQQSKAFVLELLKLPAHQYPLLPINANLEAALIEGKRLSGNALKRHLNYLTRLVIEQDEAAIRHAHQHVNHPYVNDSAKMQRIAHEISQLIADDSDIIATLLGQYIDFDVQHVRQLAREARKHEHAQLSLPTEQRDTSPSKHHQQLRRYLQSLALYYNP